MIHRVKIAVLGVLGLLAGCGQDAGLAPSFTQNPATVFINEIHYDNTGADVGEAVEVAGPAGTDLTGWKLVPYNGNGGAVYSPTITLAGTILDQGNGYGTLSVVLTGLQNGAPDGLALVNLVGEVVQFLSYEGEFTAVGGSADGLASTDIGVSENGSEAQGLSLQLKGSGATYQDFTWSAASDDSFGEVNAGQTFLAAGDIPPTVTSTSPADGATGVALDSPVSITFSEAVKVDETGVSLICADKSVAFTGTLNDAGTVYTLEPTQPFDRAESCTVTLAAGAVTDRDGKPDTLVADYSLTFTTFGAVTKVHEIQGTTETSPLVGQTVTIEGVVVGDFEGASPALRGFYVQEEEADQDSDPATSEGIFVFNGNANSVSVGQTVSVTGAVGEQFGQTQISASTVTPLGTTGTVPETTVTLPVASLNDLEALEGMLVRFPQSLVISEYFNYDRFGEIVLAQPPSGLKRPYTPTSYVEPGSEAAAVADLNARSRITLDDASTAQNPSVNRHPNGQLFSLTNRFRGGDTVKNTTGILTYGFSLYRVQPTAPAAYISVNMRTPAPDPVGGSLKVASFNVLNYFTTLTSEDSNARGADTPEEFIRQQAKIVAALKAIDADIFGLIEIENNEDTAVQNLVNALNASVGADTYTFVPTGKIGTDAIKVALIYKSATMTPVGEFAILDSSVDTSFIDTANRPVLIQTFDEVGTLGRFTIAVNHLKSKGSDCNDLGDPDAGDGQGNCNLTRTRAAEALADYLATDPTGSGDPDFLIVGDLNSYDEEDPIDALKAAGYTDLNEAFGGEFAYSYAFDGQFGYLDYALSSTTLTDQVTGTTEWHINSDEPDLLDYDMTFKSSAQDAIYAPDPYRASDHDPVVVGLDLDAPDPAELLEALIAEVEALGLKQGDERALLAQLETAQRHVQRAQASLAEAALERFEMQVNRLARKGALTPEQAEALLEDSAAIRALL